MHECVVFTLQPIGLKHRMEDCEYPKEVKGYILVMHFHSYSNRAPTLGSEVWTAQGGFKGLVVMQFHS